MPAAGNLIRELTRATLAGCTDAQVAAFVCLLESIFAQGRDRKDVRLLARLAEAEAYTLTQAFASQLANFARKHTTGAAE